MAKKYKSDALAAIHETMEGLFEVGAIDMQTMRKFDEGCLTSVGSLTPEEINPSGSGRTFHSRFLLVI